MINVDINRCECECGIELLDLFMKGIRVRTDSREKAFKSGRSGWKGRQINLTLKTALGKFFIIESGSSELFRILMQSMAVSTFNIHRIKIMMFRRFLVCLLARR
jgi:hypothetical protein